MGKEMTRTAYRDEVVEEIRKFLEDKYATYSRYTGSGEIMLPAVDAEGNEFYFTLKAAIPRGTRNGNGGYDPYDGDAVADEWEAEQKAKAEEKAAKAAEKARQAEEKRRAKEAKKTVKKLNKKGLDGMIHEEEGAV